MGTYRRLGRAFYLEYIAGSQAGRNEPGSVLGTDKLGSLCIGRGYCVVVGGKSD